MNAFCPEPITIDPRPCSLCGLTIDRHLMVDHGEGPEFHCLPLDEQTLPELERRAELIRQIEVAEIFASLEAMDDPSKRSPPPEPRKRPYVTPESTRQAFLFVARNHDAAYLARWLERHPLDIVTLTKLWEAKNGHS
jgi:hypothetical protein